MMFAEYLRKVIGERKYSYRKLGDLSGVNHTYISKICKGTSGTPSPEILKKLAIPLCIPYEELLKAAGYLLAENKDLYTSGEGEDISVRVAKLGSESKARLKEYLDFLEDWEKKQHRSKLKEKKKTIKNGSD